ncbi:MAG: VCBS domain-containing protein [Synechococcus sp.]|nr:VCBS domain-containing protein [Synechococcus sp.]
MDDLFKSDLETSSTGLNSGGDIGSSSSENGSGDWTNPQQSGLDGDLQRSQQAVALNELLQEQGLEGGAVDALVQGDSYAELGGASDDPLLSEVAPPPLALSLVVLDQSLQNWRELAVSAPADAELLVLDQASDGVAQISDHLLQQRLGGQGSYSSLAIVSAGADGLLQLGNGTLEAANLSSYGDQLRTWADSLSSGADLLLLGSNVAASRDSTGATEQGGNVVLEEQTGSIETSLSWLEQGIEELPSHFLVVGEEPLGDGNDVLANWQYALADTSQLLRELPQRQEFAALIEEVFGQAGTAPEVFAGRVAELAQRLQSDGLGLEIELRSGAELNGARAAYAAQGHTGTERIYVNADWLASGASAAEISQVLLEESGHAIDLRLNAELESPGDEGELFAARLLDQPLSEGQLERISADVDQQILEIDGVLVAVQTAGEVTGSNNPAVISGDLTGSVTEDGGEGGEFTTGFLSVSDDDNGEGSFFSTSPLSGTYGSFTFEGGFWSYTLNNGSTEVQSLPEGETVIDTLTVTTDDGTTETITVTINGTNDAPAATFAEPQFAIEHGETISGQLTSTDVDVSTETQRDTTEGSAVKFVLNASAGSEISFSWEFTSDDYLPYEDFAFVAIGGQIFGLATVTAPAAGGDNAKSGVFTYTIQNADINSTGKTRLSIGIADVKDTIVDSRILISDLSFNANEAVLHGAVTTYASSAANTTYAISTGNEGGQPPLTQTDLETALGISQGTLDRALQFGTTASYALADEGSIAGLTIGSNGAWFFDPSDEAYQSLAEGETQIVTVNYSVTDNQDASDAGSFTITVTGTNDAASISGTSTGSVTEDGVLTASGSLSVSDADSGQSVFAPVEASALSGSYGTWSFDSSSGAWSYLLNNDNASVEALVTGSTLTDSLTVQSVDLSDSETITVTINGASYLPLLTLISTTTFTEDAPSNAVGSVVATFSTSDPEGNTVTVTLSDTTNYSLGTGENAGQVLLTAAGLELVNAGTDLPPFTLTPNDGSTNGSAVSVDPAVAAVNDTPPVTVVDLNLEASDFNVLDSDGDGEPDFTIASVVQAEMTSIGFTFVDPVTGEEEQIPFLQIDELGLTEDASASQALEIVGTPFAFTLTDLEDVSPDEDGIQVVLYIDLIENNLKAGDITGFAKFISQETIDAAKLAGLTLYDLDGNAIVEEGWVDFTRRDSEGNGAEFVIEAGKILGVNLYLTDNLLGDNDFRLDVLVDPGIFYRLVNTESPDNVTPPPDQPAPQSGVFELASVGSTDSTFASSVATPGETVTLETMAAEEATAETTADSGASTGSDGGSGSTKPDNSLVLAYAKRAFDDLMTWATSSGLISLPADGQGASAGNGNGTRSTTTDESRTLAFVSQALGIEPSLASGMLEALALGGASLYAINRFGGGRLSSWVRKLLPAAPQAAAATAERIVVVFKLLSQAGLQCLVAARVDAGKLEILAEQALPMSLSAAAAPSQADLEPHLRKLVERVSNQTGTHDLLLYDPHLRHELPVYDSLGRMQAELQPQGLDGILASLGPDQLVELRSWINRPSGTDLRQHPVGDRLERRQRELRQRMDTDKASLISLLELSLALGQRFA